MQESEQDPVSHLALSSIAVLLHILVSPDNTSFGGAGACTAIMFGSYSRYSLIPEDGEIEDTELKRNDRVRSRTALDSFLSARYMLFISIVLNGFLLTYVLYTRIREALPDSSGSFQGLYCMLSTNSTIYYADTELTNTYIQLQYKTRSATSSRPSKPLSTQTVSSPAFQLPR